MAPAPRHPRRPLVWRGSLGSTDFHREPLSGSFRTPTSSERRIIGRPTQASWSDTLDNRRHGRDRRHSLSTVPAISRIRLGLPEAFSDGQLDLDRLAELAGHGAATGPERYWLTWPGEREAVAMLQAPSRATLVPERGQSVNFDDAGHVFIERENLEVLKLLQILFRTGEADPHRSAVQHGQRFHLSRRFFGAACGLSSPDRQMTEDGDMTTTAPDFPQRLTAQLSRIFANAQMTSTSSSCSPIKKNQNTT
jgi:hypothetical protein